MIMISKNVRILFSVKFSRCDLEHKHNQCECDSITDEEYMLVIMEYIFTYLFHLPLSHLKNIEFGVIILSISINYIYFLFVSELVKYKLLNDFSKHNHIGHGNILPQ